MSADHAGVAQGRQVLRNAGGGDAGAPGELGRGRRGSQFGEEGGPGAAENGSDSLGVRDRSVREEQAGAPSRVGELRRVRWT
jgi:hypothetical protein